MIKSHICAIHPFFKIFTQLEAVKALQKAGKSLFVLCLCAESFTFGLSCPHTLQEKLQANDSLNIDDLHSFWIWVKGSSQSSVQRDFDSFEDTHTELHEVNNSAAPHEQARFALSD